MSGAIVSPYLTAAEAQAYLRLGSATALYRLVREHGLPYCRKGRHYLFDRRDIDAWIHQTGSLTVSDRTLARVRRGTGGV
jgi:excisionase family DNA binding protein